MSTPENTSQTPEPTKTRCIISLAWLNSSLVITLPISIPESVEILLKAEGQPQVVEVWKCLGQRSDIGTGNTDLSGSCLLSLSLQKQSRGTDG